MPKKPTTGRVPRTCEQCGKGFFTWPSTVTAGKGKLCGTACYNVARSVATATTKVCGACRRNLPHAAFHRRSKTTCGLATNCRECAAIQARAWRAKRPTYSTEWARAKFGHQPRISVPKDVQQQRANARARRYYLADIERWRAYGRLKAAGYPESRRAAARTRKARKAGANGACTAEQLFARCSFYGWRCYLCGLPLTEKSLTVEHRIPLCRGGSNWPANLAPACRACNSRKGTLTETEYRARIATEAHSAAPL